MHVERPPTRAIGLVRPVLLHESATSSTARLPQWVAPTSLRTPQPPARAPMMSVIRKQECAEVNAPADMSPAPATVTTSVRT